MTALVIRPLPFWGQEPRDRQDSLCLSKPRKRRLALRGGGHSSPSGKEHVNRFRFILWLSWGAQPPQMGSPCLCSRVRGQRSIELLRLRGVQHTGPTMSCCQKPELLSPKPGVGVRWAALGDPAA